jgi:hypothetical protein
MERTRGGYWREAGCWGVRDGFVDGKHVVVGGYFLGDEEDYYFWNDPEKKWYKSSHCVGVELVPITREQFLGDT